jgi:hypothetical protein
MGDGPKGTSLGMCYLYFTIFMHTLLTKPVEIPNNPEPRTASPWLFDENGKQVTPSIDGLPLEDGHPTDNNAKRFMKKREGLYVVMVPVDKRHAPQNHAGTAHAHTEDENGMLVMDD